MDEAQQRPCLSTVKPPTVVMKEFNKRNAKFHKTKLSWVLLSFAVRGQLGLSAVT
jgi:hypothetical protein